MRSGILWYYRMRRTISLLLGVSLLVLIGVGIRNYMNTTEPTACAERFPTPRVVAFGDSLVTGYGSATPGGFVTMIANDISVPIENFGKNGDTTASARERVATVAARKPDIVLVLLGGNDALRRVSATEVEDNLTYIVSTLTEQGTHVILLGVPGGLPFSDPYPKMFTRIAENARVTYVPNILSGVFGVRDRVSDGIHPNEVGYRMIADAVTPVVQRVCGELVGDK